MIFPGPPLLDEEVRSQSGGKDEKSAHAVFRKIIINGINVVAFRPDCQPHSPGKPVMRQKIQFTILSLCLLTVIFSEGRSEDWPMWRHDAGRSASSSDQLASDLTLRWTRQLAAPQLAWPEDPRIHFDATLEPVSTGNLVFVASPTTDSVIALDANTGVVRWKVFADGPVRFAPVVAHQQVYFGADDGFIYCVEAESGTLLWRKEARPAPRKVIGSERIISVWPIRGGPVLYNDQVYFTAGVWPFEGVLLYQFPVAANQQKAPSFQSRTLNSLTPQGYAVAAGGRVYLPCGRGISACLDLESDQMLPLSYGGKTDYHVTALGDFIFHGNQVYNVPEKRVLKSDVHRPVNGPDGVVGTRGDEIVGLNAKNPTFVEVVDRKGNKQKVQILPVAWKMTRGQLAEAVSETSADWKIHLQAGTRYYGHIGKQIFALQPAGDTQSAKVIWHATIDSPARSMIAANGRLIVVSASSRLYSFLPRSAGVTNLGLETTALKAPPADGPWAALARQVVTETSDLEAYCLVAGIGSGELVDQLLAHTQLRLLVMDSSAEKVAALRERCEKAGLYGTRLAAQVGEPGTAQLPVYFAGVIVAGEPYRGDLGALYRSLRPYGGNAYLPTEENVHERIEQIVKAGGLPEAKLKWESGITRITRAGALAGSSNWTHEYGDAANSLTSSDELVKAPLGVLWFGGPAAAGELFYNRHYWAPSMAVIDGRMFIEGPQVFAAIDVYTGRVLWKIKLPEGTSPGRRGNFFEQVRVGFHYVVASDYIYLSDGNSCKLLDPVTGKTVKELTLPSTEQRWGRMRISNDLLVATIWEKKDGEEMPVAIQAFDRTSGDPYWRHEATVSCPLVAIGKDKVYYFDGALSHLYDDWKRKGLVPEASKYRVLKAIDTRTGEQVWEQVTNQIVTWVGFSEDADVLISSNKKGIEARSGESGKALWQKTAEGKGFRGHPENLWDRVILWKDRIIDQRGPGLSYDLKTGEPIMQKHPITGEELPWQFTKAGHHCNYAVASPHLVTFRAATAGFLDLESGTTGRLEGFRSGCRNSLIPANGVLNAPNFAHGCSCSYNLFTSLALVHVPDVELWTYSAYEKRDTPVDRVGINLGAPGDRIAKSGTMWLDYPNVGGPSPDVTVQVFPRAPSYFRKHSSQVKGEGLAWVAASGCKDLESLIVTTSKETENRNYKVRLFFAEPESLSEGDRVFDVLLQGKAVLENFDIVREAGGSQKIVVREFQVVTSEGRLQINLKPRSGAPLLCGIELIAQ